MKKIFARTLFYLLVVAATAAIVAIIVKAAYDAYKEWPQSGYAAVGMGIMFAVAFTVVKLLVWAYKNK